MYIGMILGVAGFRFCLMKQGPAGYIVAVGINTRKARPRIQSVVIHDVIHNGQSLHRIRATHSYM